MRQDSVAQRGIGQSCDHRNLDGGHDLRRADTERRETEDAVAVSFDQRLQKASRFRQRARTQYGFHGNLEHAVRHASHFGFVLTESNAGQFRVREQAIRHVPARRRMVNADEVVMYHTEIVNADVGKLQAAKSLTHVFVFSRHQPLVAVDHRHGTPESAHRLGQLYADVAAADYKQVCGNFVEFERLDVREWLRFSQTRNGSQRGPRTGTDDHVRATQLAAGPVGESNLQRSRSDEPSGSHNELRSRVPVIVQIHLVHARHHLALAVTDARHINREAVVSDAELLTSAKVRCDLRAVDDVFAWQARDVRTRSTN